MDKINLQDQVGRIDKFWLPVVVGELNGQHIKLVRFHGPFVWHHHDHEDEAFLVVAGSFRMEYRDRAVEMGVGDLVVVPRGVEHRPVADGEAAVLLFEPAETVNTGNIRNERTVLDLPRA